MTAHPLYVIRHAKAGSRREWRGSDDRRPLSEPGREQAAGLVGTFAGLDVEAIISSSSLRCIQTVEPLAAARGLSVQTDPVLAEGADPAAALRFADPTSDRRPAVTLYPSSADLIRGVPPPGDPPAPPTPRVRDASPGRRVASPRRPFLRSVSADPGPWARPPRRSGTSSGRRNR